MTINKSPIDPYTLVHAAAGVAAYKHGWTLWQTLAAGFVWDYLVEPEAKKRCAACFTHPSQDTPTHALIDAVTPAIAWKLTEWYLERR